MPTIPCNYHNTETGTVTPFTAEYTIADGCIKIQIPEDYPVELNQVFYHNDLSGWKPNFTEVEDFNNFYFPNTGVNSFKYVDNITNTFNNKITMLNGDMPNMVNVIDANNSFFNLGLKVNDTSSNIRSYSKTYFIRADRKITNVCIPPHLVNANNMFNNTPCTGEITLPESLIDASNMFFNSSVYNRTNTDYKYSTPIVYQAEGITGDISLPPSLRFANGMFRNCYCINSEVFLPTSLESVVNLFAVEFDMSRPVNESVTNNGASFSSRIGNIYGSPVMPSKTTVNIIDALYMCTNISGDPIVSPTINKANNTYSGCINLDGVLPTLPVSLEYTDNMFAMCNRLRGVPSVPAYAVYTESMFSGCYNINGTAVIPPYISSYTKMYEKCCNIEHMPSSLPTGVSYYKCSSVFDECYRMKGEPMVSPVCNNMYRMYYNCRNLTGSPVSPADAICDMSYAYIRCDNLTGSPVAGNNVYSMNNTYCECRNLSGTAVIPSTVKDCSFAYQSCKSLDYLCNIPDSATIVNGCFAGIGSAEYSSNSMQFTDHYYIGNNANNLYNLFYKTSVSNIHINNTSVDNVKCLIGLKREGMTFNIPFISQDIYLTGPLGDYSGMSVTNATIWNSGHSSSIFIGAGDWILDSTNNLYYFSVMVDPGGGLPDEEFRCNVHYGP